MREADDRGVYALLEDLEYMRERATVQVLLAQRDYERRYAAPRKASS
jgi:hypothetical protein